jgi:hypothetical protein
VESHEGLPTMRCSRYALDEFNKILRVGDEHMLAIRAKNPEDFIYNRKT